ncbi:MAG: PhzF family phenazine biosynthesis protein [bacterium]|nr:PhzF family phenazine biosynthesis protein [bacterium]
MELRLFQVDVFTSRVFGGNPAGVVPLKEWLADDVLQAIGQENNLSETAFFVPAKDEDDVDYHLRWFTPQIEVDLCGHATVATAHVLANHLGVNRSRLRFSTLSGEVAVSGDASRFVLDFPAWHGESGPPVEEVTTALGQQPVAVRQSRDLLAVFEREEEVRKLDPDTQRVAELDALGVIVTAPGSQPGVDFVSRFFAPRAGIPEDPVTGSAHCTLIPYWADRLGKTELHALQVSERGGELFCRNDAQAGRVHIGGHAVTYLEGTIRI